MITGDTIAAISSGIGPAARIILRLSGPQARSISQQLATAVPCHAQAQRAHLSVAGLTCPATLYAFVSPGSYTGEDLVEFHIPGNPVLARMLLDALLSAGARQAEAGEFTGRAWVNGRIDLSEAEGVAAVIAAQNEQELAAARQLLAGELSRRLQPPMDLLAQTLALVEVGIDFTEEDVTFLDTRAVQQRIGQVERTLDELLAQSARFERLSHEPQIVLAGWPNAGKSTLLNMLAGQERAVVSPLAGTTRDVIWAEAPLKRGMVRLTDAAGLEPAEPETSGPAGQIARQMRQRALAAIASADRVVLVHAADDPRPLPVLPRPADLVVRSKSDLAPHDGREGLRISAQTGEGLDALRVRLDELAFGQPGPDAAVALNARHLHAINEALAALQRCSAACDDDLGSEIVALELREALDALGRILGTITPDDLLGRIFSAFCIGK